MTYTTAYIGDFYNSPTNFIPYEDYEKYACTSSTVEPELEFQEEKEIIEPYTYKHFKTTNKKLHIPKQQRNVRAEIMTAMWRR